MERDERYLFFSKIISGLFDDLDIDKFLSILNKSKDTRDFLDDFNTKTIKISFYSNGNINIDANNGNSKETIDQNHKEVIFVKRLLQPLTPDNIWKSIDVHTFHGPPLEGLYSTVKGVFSPALLNDNSTQASNPRIHQLLLELESSLHGFVQTDNDRGRDHNLLENTSNIQNPTDEARLWERLLDDRKSPYRNLAKEILPYLKELNSFSELDSKEFEEIEELIDKTLDYLNSVWSAVVEGNKYPQNRMVHLFGVIGTLLSNRIQNSVSSIAIWGGGGDEGGNENESKSESEAGVSGQTRASIQYAIILCEKWLEVTKKLTLIFWTSSDHPWKGNAYVDSFIDAFRTRLNQITSITNLSDELFQLLSKEEKRSFSRDRLYSPFQDINPFLYNPYTDAKWKKALKDFETLIEPIEASVASSFRKNASQIINNPQMLFREFQKYKNLMERPTIRKNLVSERETLMSMVNEIIRTYELNIDQIESGQIFESVDNYNSVSNKEGIISNKVSGIVILKQLSAKILSLMSTCKSLLNDINGYESMFKNCENLTHRVRGEINGRFEAWLQDMQGKIEDDHPAFQLKGSLMTWSKDGILTVNFSNELVVFLREYRQLDELGFEMPKPSSGRSKQRNVTDKVIEADKYYRYGILLKKTATFFNNIKEQIIDVQEQLLLDSLKSFVSLVSKRDSDIVWSNSADCENYIRILQDAAEKLSSENRWLRKVHESLVSQTILLMSVDLLRQTDLWKSRWRSLKEKLLSVKSKYSDVNSKLWVLHWDNQVYKALESGYQMGLESLNENLPEIKAEIVISNKNLEFKPPLEQIRQSYYHEVRKFVSIPSSFEGFGNGFIFKKMGAKCSPQLVQVFSKAELLFDKLTALLKFNLGWIKIDQIDMDQFIEAHVKTVDEYIANFKMIRVKRKEIDKLPDQEKIACCLISFTTFKSQLEDMFNRLSDALLIHLRRNLLVEFKEVDQFLEYASDKLSSRPHTVEEIGNAKKVWKEIDSKKDVMKSTSKSCMDKKKLLLQYAAGSMIDLSEIISKMANLNGEGGRWDDFDIAHEAFNDMVEEQKEALKGTLEEDVVGLNVSIDKFGNRWRQLKPTESKSWEYSEIQKIFVALEDWKTQFDELQNTSTTLSENCVLFGLSKPRFDGLEALIEDFVSVSKSWDILKTYYDELNVISEQDWLTFSVNVYVLQDFSSKWSEQLKGYKLDNISEHILTSVEKIKKSVPSLKYCRGEPFKEDHWTELLQGKLQLSRDVRRDNVKVEHFLSRLDILMEPSTLSYVKNLQSRALGEVQIREALQELRAWERSAEVTILTQEESGRKIPLIKDWKDLFLEVGDKQSLLSSLKESQFFKAFSDQGNALELKMTVIDFVLQTLNLIQRKWVYLEPIFGRGALPSEEARFKRVDEDFSDIMVSFSREPKLFYFADEQFFPHLSDKLKTMLDQLERCQKALSEFLEAKRSSMPRFYFIGDDDLLEILGQSKNPNVIQSHLKKLFQGIHKVKFNQDSTKIVAMISSANEIVELETPIQITDKVEIWLEMLSKEMKSTLSTLLTKCLDTRSKALDWSYPSQIICLSQSITFTEYAESAIEEGKEAINNLKQNLIGNLRQLTSQDFSNDVLSQLKMKSLVLDLVHNIDVLSQIYSKSVRKIGEWQWKKQLRYYFEKGKTLVRMSDAEFHYSFEYQGNAPKLVHTPLTDKCYLTLTQGVRMGFGGNPYGPAGTGKTESVKALASCLGRQVLVFNCDEGIDFQSMGRIFIGLVKCGAWGCFDEFNRLKEDQLSAISQQIQVIQDAIKIKSSPIQLLGRNVDVNFEAGIFVTLNPAGKGYGGRSRLPDNLKALFRPICMGAPDNELIAEVNLVTEGFTQAKDLASKIVSLFKLSRQLLSPQQHYDWGLRALKAVLNSGGRLIQNYKLEGLDITSDMEYEILIKAVRVNTLSKLTYSDTSKFLALIGDVFPGAKSSDISGGELEEAIKEVMKQKPFYLLEDAAQIKKMIQLKESLDQRMGCVIVGPSGCGKSVLWRVLKSALIKCGKSVVTHVMNPKSMPRERLLGRMDLDTREWFDGVLTDAARKVVKEPSEVSCWVICDGDVDPEWIESLNSVLDDNHLLTLPNGERISFGSNVNFLFETHDLKYASPATVSRMGMIFLSDEDLEIKRLVERWITMLPQEKHMQMSSWIDELFYKSLKYVGTFEFIVDTTLVGTLMNGLSQVKNSNSRQEFIVGLIRGLGGNLSITNRVTFAKEVFQWASERPADIGSPLDCYADGSSFMAFDPPPRGNSRDLFPLEEIGDSAVVKTITMKRTLKTMESWLDNMEPFILVGPEGCGKSTMINYAFRSKKNIGIAVINCNAQTTADDVIRKIAQTCSLFSSPDGRVYRPRDCERLVLYLKDINLPRPDMYDTCQLIAFLQQLITFDGFYDDALEFLKLDRIQIVASINAATTVGRHPLSPRFTAIVRILVVDYPDTSELVSIYDCFLNSVFNRVNLADKKWLSPTESERLANSIVEIYQKTREKFTVDEQRHYLFTPRDITILVKNICRYDLSSENLLDVIMYESNRMFRDRLVGADSQNRYDQMLSQIMRSQFKHSSLSNNIFFTSITSPRGGMNKSEGKDSETASSPTEILGGRLWRMSEEELTKLISQGLVYYEREEKDLNMLLFPEILENITHIDRTISTHKGHLLLVGRAGVGRRNCTTIVSYMLGYEFYTPAISRDYQMKQFFVDVKSVLHTAGVKGEHIVFFLEDFQLVSDFILEVTNSLISSGEVPGLYTHEDLETLLGPLREKMREDGGSYRTPYEFFISRVKKYLHVVISMDPNNSQFLYRCEANPALYSQCTVLWLGEWKSNTLKMIPKLMDGVKDLVYGESYSSSSSSSESKDNSEGKRGESKLDESEYKNSDMNLLSENRSDKIIELILGIHGSCSSNHGASPKEFQVFLSSWLSLYNSKEKEVRAQLVNLTAGLSKLDSASDVVNDLRTNAAQQQKDLAVAQAAADRAMEEISKALSSATERRVEVTNISKTVAADKEVTDAKKREIEEQLAEIQPVLDSAKLAVGQIKSEHLNEIRSLTAPPEAIADVLAAVLMLLGVQDLSWLSMKKFLGNRGVKDDILNFNAKTISLELRKNVSKMIKKKAESFEAANITRVSVAAAPMAAWVKANIRYSLVIEKIEPLESELEQEVFKLEQSQKRLERCEDELKELDDRVGALKNEFAERTAEAERLKRNLSIAGTTLDKAEGLINQLGGEQTRWKTQAAQLNSDLQKLPIKMLLAAGFVTYLAKAPEDIRAQLITQWQDLSGVQSFSFKRVMSSESELLLWKSMGLPSDDLSQENGLVITSLSDRVPLIIDPASAAVDWLRGTLGKDRNRPLEVISHHDKRFTNQLELSVRFGKTLIILEVDGLEPMLYPLCRRDLCHQGPRYVVGVGDKIVDYNENFRLFLVTRNPEPNIPPDAASIVTVVNFTVTRSGLEGQLLGLAIQHEQPELEKAKGEMLKREEDFKVQLAGLEKDLLQALATTEGNLLENTALIESLTRTKEKAAEIEEALLKSAETSSQLDQQREVYRIFANSGSKVFFLVKSLQNVCHMYQFSLSSFIQLYNEALSAPLEAKHIDERLSKLCADIEVRVLYYVGRALVKSDRAMFAMHLAKGMHPDHFQPREWEIFIGNFVVSINDSGSLRNYPSWAPVDRQSHFRLLSEQLPHLISSLELENTSKWQRFSSSLEAEKEIPSLRGVSLFQKVLIIQALRPDRLYSAILNFCCDLMRIESVSPPALSLNSLYEESSSMSPILLISSPGADPSKELQEFASKTIGVGNYDELAMGGGQQEIAMNMLRSAASNGTWLCLKNLHLVVAWLPTLEKELSSLQPNQEFRLWLTSESHSSFPSILLQQSLKVAYESPPGIKKNLLRAFDSWSPDDFPADNPLRSRLIFLLTCFHAVIQERRTYLPQGWTKFYEFSYGDMKAGTYVMEAITANKKSSGGLDWETIHGLLEDAIYGGRVDNVYDLRVLRTYLRMFFSDQLVGDNSGGKEIIMGTPLRMPSSTSYEAFIKTIGLLPDIDPPYVFNLPDNIERSLQRSSSQAAIKQLRLLSVVDAEAQRYDREKWRSQLNPIIELWQQLLSSSGGALSKKNNVIPGAGAGSNKDKNQISKPIDDFVDLEVELAHELCTHVDSSLSSLKKVLFGSGLLTPGIQSIAQALLSDTVPQEWNKRWEGPEKPQLWLGELTRKRAAIMRWKSLTSKGNFLQEPVCLGELFNPATFINALRQQTARQLEIAIDRMKMICGWDRDMKKINSSCVLSCSLTGLYLQGATFHGGILRESSSDANEISSAPNVAFGFINSPNDRDKDRDSSEEGSIGIPLYLTPTREEFLMELQMPIEGEKDKWILSGVALFMSED